MDDENQSLKDEVEALKAQVATYQAWFRAIDEYAKFDFWFKDSDSNYSYVNPHFAKNMGREKSLLEEKPLDEIFEGGRLQRVRALDQKIMSEGYLSRVIPCDVSGTLEMHEEHRFVVKGDNGEPIGLGCFAFEVTEKSLAEETLQQAEKLANLCSWRWSAESNTLVSCSDQMAEFLGVALTEAFEIFPKRFEMLVVPEDKHLFSVVEDRINGDSNESYEIQYRLRRQDGEIIYVREKAEPFSSGSGATEYIGVMQDITQQKKAEQALHIANENLENKVLIRTAELEKAKDAAIKSNEAKTLFLASMSHELKTPLNAIIGFSDLMTKQALGPLGHDDYLDLSKHILKSGENLSKMIDDVLVVAGTQDESQGAIDFKSIALAPLIESAIKKIKPECAAHNIGVVWTKPEQDFELNCNKQRLSRVLDGILNNAIKFNKKGGFIKIKMSPTPDDASISGVLIDIIDTGMGISNHDLENIMAPFVQVDNSYTRAHDGAGLGLAIAKRWVELHEGKISIASKIDKGTVVRIFLPATVQANGNIETERVTENLKQSA